MSNNYFNYIYESDVFMASLELENDLFLYEETNFKSSAKRIFNSFVEFLQKVMKAIKEFLDDMKYAFKKKLGKDDPSKVLKEIKERAEEFEKQGRKVDFFDVWEYEQTYCTLASQLIRTTEDMFKFFSNTSSIKDVEDDVDQVVKKCKELCEKGDEKLLKIKNTKIKVSAIKLSKWLDENWDIDNNKASGHLKKMMDIVDDIMGKVKKYENQLEDYSLNTGYTPNATRPEDIKLNKIIKKGERREEREKEREERNEEKERQREEARKKREEELARRQEQAERLRAEREKELEKASEQTEFQTATISAMKEQVSTSTSFMKKHHKLIMTAINIAVGSLLIYTANKRGYNEGNLDGYAKGSEHGQEIGRHHGYKDGYEKGESDGFTRGYHKATVDNDDAWWNR